MDGALTPCWIGHLSTMWNFRSALEKPMNVLSSWRDDIKFFDGPSNCFSLSQESSDHSNEGIIQALNYTVPQINRQPNVYDYSPTQWILGYTPALPGNLTEESITPQQLSPTEAFRQKLEYQQLATTSIAQASNDDRFRRALLRQYRGNVQVLKLGGRCHYYRDLPQDKTTIGPKVLWQGPATLVMIENENKVYWLSHGAVLIRASFEHVRPVPGSHNTDDTTLPIDKAKHGLHAIRNRGTTRYLDLTKTNKRRATDIDSDDEMADFDDQPNDPSDPPIYLGLPSQPSGIKRSISEPTEEPPSKTPRENESVHATPLILTGHVEAPGAAPTDLVTQNQAATTSQQPEVGDSERLTAGSGGSHPAAGAPPQLPQQGTLSTGATPETFAQQRARHERGETDTLFKALRNNPTSATRREEAKPYPNREPETALQQRDVDALQQSQLPPGWKVNDNGYLVMDKINDEWQLQGNWLYRRHYLARDDTFTPEADDCPFSPDWLQKDRETYDGHHHQHDRWKHGQVRKPGAWTGWTRFKIQSFATHLFPIQPSPLISFRSNPSQLISFRSNPSQLISFPPILLDPSLSDPTLLNSFLSHQSFSTHLFRIQPFSTHFFPVQSFPTHFFRIQPFSTHPSSAQSFPTHLFPAQPFSTHFFRAQPFSTHPSPTQSFGVAGMCVF